MTSDIDEPIRDDGVSPESGDDRGPLDTEFVKEIRTAVNAGDRALLDTLIEPLHAADIADLAELLDGGERRAFIVLIKDDIDPDILSELEESVRDVALDILDPKDVAEAVTQMDTDDAVFLLEDLAEADQREVLDALPADDRAAIEESLGYPEDSAGRLMQRELIAVPEFWTVGQTIDYLRETEDLPDDFYEIFVVSPQHKPVGAIPLSHLMRTKRPVKVQDIMNTDMNVISVRTDQEDVAYKFSQYHLISTPVADETGRLVGVITVDDIVDVIEEEAEEDFFALRGISGGDLNTPVREVTRTRFIWLLVNLGTAVLASAVIALFDASIEQLVALAVLMPIVASMGGNAGTQTMTVAVRAMATKELTSSNALRIVNKELIVSTINGILLAIIIGVVAGLWFASPPLGLVLAAAMIINMMVAGLAGILVPISLEKMGIDPAIASSVFVTTITDVIGFLAFLGLAASFLL